MSAYPAVERAYRDTVESIFAVEHDIGLASTNKTGRHKFGIGNDAARDAISNWPDGAIWLSTEGNNAGNPHKQARVSGAWVDVGDKVGAIIVWPTNSAPAGYLLCDGAAVSRTTYNRLFALISTTYGVGDGSTTFNVPNMKGRTVVGRDALQTEFDVLGETGGAKTITLASGNIPAHTHTRQAHWPLHQVARIHTTSPTATTQVAALVAMSPATIRR